MELSQKYLILVDKAKQCISEISADQTFSLMHNKETLVLIDVREESEWKSIRIPGAIYIGKGILEREIEAIVPNVNTKIVLYCGGGYRSALSAENLQRMGYKYVYSMSGGITEWGEKNFPINNNKI
jgi:rhodanese-related sulfurtransferase